MHATYLLKLTKSDFTQCKQQIYEAYMKNIEVLQAKLDEVNKPLPTKVINTTLKSQSYTLYSLNDKHKLITLGVIKFNTRYKTVELNTNCMDIIKQHEILIILETYLNQLKAPNYAKRVTYIESSYVTKVSYYGDKEKAKQLRG